MKPVKEWEDPLVGILLLLLVVATVVVFILLRDPQKIADKDLGDLLIKAAGGTLLLLSSYFAARTLNQNRNDQRYGRILQAAGMLGKAETHNAAKVILADLKATAGAKHQALIEDLLATPAPGDG